MQTMSVQVDLPLMDEFLKIGGNGCASPLEAGKGDYSTMLPLS